MRWSAIHFRSPPCLLPGITGGPERRICYGLAVLAGAPAPGPRSRELRQRLVSHHEGPTFLRPCVTNLPADTYLAAGGMSRTAADYASSGMPSSSVGPGSSADTEANAAPGLGSPTEEIEARRPVPGSLAVQRSVHDLASLQYQRMSAQACPPSGTIRSSGNAMPHSEHWVDCDGRGWSLRCLAIGAAIRESRGACNTRPGPPLACVAREATEAAAEPRSNPGLDHRRSRGRQAHTRRCRRPGSGRPRCRPTGTAGPPRCRDRADRRAGPS